MQKLLIVGMVSAFLFALPFSAMAGSEHPAEAPPPYTHG